MKINILAGNCSPGKITLTSDRFTSIVHYHPGSEDMEDSFTPTVKKVPQALKAAIKYLEWPIPRLLRVFLIMWANSNILMKLVLLYTAYGLTFSKPHYIPIPHVRFSEPVYWLAWIALIAAAFYLKKIWGGWHGAEHMAIACYDEHQRFEAAYIATQSRVSKNCGGRFVLPVLVICYLVQSPAAKSLSELNLKLVTLMLLEGFLWIDHLFGFGNIPVFSQASFLLQKYITTCPPGEKELKTASLALENLMAAHEEGI